MKRDPRIVLGDEGPVRIARRFSSDELAAIATTRPHTPRSTHARDVARRVAAIIVGLAVLAAVAGATTGPVTAQIEAPQRGTPLAAVWLDVGETAAVDVSSAFVGPVDSYSARSQDATAVSFSIAGSTLSLGAVAVGVAFIEIKATNAAGSTRQWIGVAAGIPRPTAAASVAPADQYEGSAERSATTDVSAGDDSRPLGIAVAAQAFCHGSHTEDMRSDGIDTNTALIDRDWVAGFRLAYSVVGGKPPYSISSPAATGAVSDPSGLLEVACAIPAPDAGKGNTQRYYQYRTGPTTIGVQARDAGGTIVNAVAVIHVSHAVFVAHADGSTSDILQVPGLENPAESYVLATPTASTLVTLAPGLDIRFERLDTEDIAHFADRNYGWEVRLDWITGREVGRTTGTVPDTNPLIVRTSPPFNIEDAEDMSPADPGWEDPTASDE